MKRRAFYSLAGSLVAVLVLVLLLVALPAQGTRADEAAPQAAPTVNGLFYGDGDYTRYTEYAVSPPLEEGGRTRGTLYKSEVISGDGDTWLYFAMVVDRSVNDNVFAERLGNAADREYLDSAGWRNNGHTFDQLYVSDNAGVVLSCGNVYSWYHGYIYDLDDDQDPTEADWLSGPEDDSTGGGTPPPSLVSASSLQWNMNNTAWDVTEGGTRAYANWKSPDLDGDNVITDEIGYPPISAQYTDSLTFETTISWEWPLVYEFAFNFSEDCTEMPARTMFVNQHNSPSKDDTHDVPTAVELLSFEATSGKNPIVLTWETASEIDSLGFNLYRAEALLEKRTKINDSLIPTNLPPGSLTGAEYSYTDRYGKPGITYYYWLETVDMHGGGELYGPIKGSLPKLILRLPPMGDLLHTIVPFKPVQ